MAQSKPLFVPWLRAQLDGSRFPGVAWTDSCHTHFSIPWKHGLRQDARSQDGLVFQAWAEVSGGSRLHADPSAWKRNFRSALRAKGFQVVADQRNDAANPHKVYRWPQGPPAASSADSSASSQSLQELPHPLQELQEVRQEVSSTAVEGVWDLQDVPVSDSLMPEVLQGSWIQVPCVNSAYFPEEAIVPVECTINPEQLGKCLLGLNITPPENVYFLEPLPVQPVIGGAALPERQQPCPVSMEVAEGGASLPPQPPGVGGACERFMDELSRTLVGESFKTHFRVAVYYRGVKVLEQLVENDSGFKLIYRPESDQTLDPQTGLSLVSLPSPDILVDQNQARITRRILERLGDGLEVGVSGPGVSGPGVYSWRRAQIKAFWSLWKAHCSGIPQEVSKMEPQPLYMFKDFVRGILGFIEGKPCPPCSLFFCLGEQWPDPKGRPWEKKLVLVEVVLTSLEILKTLAVAGGASSLQSVELQLSLEEMC